TSPPPPPQPAVAIMQIPPTATAHKDRHFTMSIRLLRMACRATPSDDVPTAWPRQDSSYRCATASTRGAFRRRSERNAGPPWQVQMEKKRPHVPIETGHAA